MDLDGLPNNGEPEAGTSVLGCEISFPDLFKVLRRDPWARVPNLHPNMGVLVPNPDLDEASLSRSIHRIQKEVPEGAEEGFIMPQNQG